MVHECGRSGTWAAKSDVPETGEGSPETMTGKIMLSGKNASRDYRSVSNGKKHLLSIGRSFQNRIPVQSPSTGRSGNEASLPRPAPPPTIHLSPLFTSTTSIVVEVYNTLNS